MPHVFEPVHEEMPTKAWHTHFIDESTATPKGHRNAGADYLNNFLKACMQDRLEKTAAGTPWRAYSKFLGWALWGYLSPDSEYQGNEQLLSMSQEWLDHLFIALQTKPEDPEKAKDWRPDRLGTWSFGDYSTPMLELEARPELATKLGAERVARYRELLMANIREYTDAESWNSLLGRSQPYINIATHPMAIYVHGWLLTGEERYWRMAASLVAILARDQLPNGMFPYRYHMYGTDHVEFEGMYYHAINIRALYMYWWATQSEVARGVIAKSTPYYPLNMAPPYTFNDGPAIWWKNLWRTFWPQHIAMVAAVTGDGENATIALDMARDTVMHDRFDLILGAHAYQQMALKGVEPTPVRDRFVLRDPDIRGVRVRFSPWSATFSTGSFTYTRASAMLVGEGKDFNALHMARPYLRVTPLENKPRYEMDYGTLSRHGAAYSAALTDTVAAVGTRYQLAATAQTWRDEQALAPFAMTELWIMTDQGIIGLIDSTALEVFEAYELNHQFRFIMGRNDKEPAATLGERRWQCGNLAFRIWDTNFPHVIEERTRRYSMAAKQRIDWQFSLADMDRLPEQLAQDEPVPSEAPPEALPDDLEAGTDADAVPDVNLSGKPKAARLPVLHEIPAGYSRYSIVEISPPDAGFTDVARLPHDSLVVLRGTTTSGTQLAVFNPTDAPQTWEAPAKHLGMTPSWPEAPVVDAQGLLTIPPAGILLLQLGD